MSVKVGYGLFRTRTGVLVSITNHRDDNPDGWNWIGLSIPRQYTSSWTDEGFYYKKSMPDSRDLVKCLIKTDQCFLQEDKIQELEKHLGVNNSIIELFCLAVIRKKMDKCNMIEEGMNHEGQ